MFSFPFDANKHDFLPSLIVEEDLMMPSGLEWISAGQESDNDADAEPQFSNFYIDIWY